MESFYPSELQRALREQSFGIAGYELLRPTSSLEASAFVTLLEGDVINISLSSRGYQASQLSYSAIHLFELIGISSNRSLETRAVHRHHKLEKYSKPLSLFSKQLAQGMRGGDVRF